MKSAYENGQAAYNADQPYNPEMSQEWRNGWKAAEALDHHQINEQE